MQVNNPKSYRESYILLTVFLHSLESLLVNLWRERLIVIVTLFE